MPALKAEELRVGEEKGIICHSRKSAFWARGVLGSLALSLGRGLFSGVRSRMCWTSTFGVRMKCAPFFLSYLCARSPGRRVLHLLTRATYGLADDQGLLVNHLGWSLGPVLPFSSPPAYSGFWRSLGEGSWLCLGIQRESCREGALLLSSGLLPPAASFLAAPCVHPVLQPKWLPGIVLGQMHTLLCCFLGWKASRKHLITGPPEGRLCKHAVSAWWPLPGPLGVWEPHENPKSGM